jgi:hypothetical protein
LIAVAAAGVLVAGLAVGFGAGFLCLYGENRASAGEASAGPGGAVAPCVLEAVGGPDLFAGVRVSDDGAAVEASLDSSDLCDPAFEGAACVVAECGVPDGVISRMGDVGGEQRFDRPPLAHHSDLW